MANQWFRLYAEFATDPKVQMLSEVMQRRYIMLLCLRCSNGDVTLHDDEVAFQLRITTEELSDTKALFTSKGLVDSGWSIAGWEKRQYISDSSAPRVAAHREKKRRGCNVTVTPPDTDTDTDTERARAQAKPARTRKPQGTPIPENFTLSDGVKTWAAGRGLSGYRVAENFAHFVLSAQAKGYVYADWDAALKKAIREDWAKSGDSATATIAPAAPASNYREYRPS